MSESHLWFQGHRPCWVHRLSMLMRNYKKSWPPQDIRSPGWCVSWVLQKLMRVPYKPLLWDFQEDWTFKIYFIFDLVSMKQEGDLMIITWRGGYHGRFPLFLSLWPRLMTLLLLSRICRIFNVVEMVLLLLWAVKWYFENRSS